MGPSSCQKRFPWTAGELIRDYRIWYLRLSGKWRLGRRAHHPHLLAWLEGSWRFEFLRFRVGSGPSFELHRSCALIEIEHARKDGFKAVFLDDHLLGRSTERSGR